MFASGDLPRVGPGEPVVGLFELTAAAEGLSEDALLVAQAVAHGGELEGGHGVEEAGGESSEAAVAEAGIGFLLEDFAEVDGGSFGGMGDEVFEE